MILIGKLITSQEESRSGYVMGYLDKLIEQKLEQHNQEIYETEKKLAEYKGLISEKQIKIEESYLKLIKRLKLIGFEHFGNRERTNNEHLLYINGEIKEVVFPATIDDWDFSSNDWDLDTSTYKSPPASLKIIPPKTPWSFTTLCKNSATINLPEGRIVVWHMRETANMDYALLLLFRNQASIGSTNRDNTYAVALGYYSARFIRNLNGSSSTLSEKDIPNLEDNTWYRHRVTWWNDPNWDALVMRLEQYDENNDTWNKACDDEVDPDNYFKDSDINRVGVGYNNPGEVIYRAWVDDVEVWAPS